MCVKFKTFNHMNHICMTYVFVSSSFCRRFGLLGQLDKHHARPHQPPRPHQTPPATHLFLFGKTERAVGCLPLGRGQGRRTADWALTKKAGCLNPSRATGAT